MLFQRNNRLDKANSALARKTKRNLYVCATYYHVYISVIKQLLTQANTDLVICDDISEGRSLCERIQKAGIFHQVWYVEQRKMPELLGKNILDWVFCQHKRRAKLLLPLLPFNPEQYSDVYFFHDGTPLGMLFNDIKKPYHLIEDSYNFYQHVLETSQARLYRPHNIKYRVRKLLDAGYFPLGESRWLIDVEVNDRNNLQVTLPNIREVKRQMLQSRLTEKNKKTILQIFGCPEINFNPEDTALVLTQPLWEDGVVSSVTDQMLLYSQIITALEEKGLSIILKPHPRDHIQYDSFSVPLLNREFPVEIFKFLLTKSFACVATVSSSAILTIDAKERYYWSKGALVNIEAK